MRLELPIAIFSLALVAAAGCRSSRAPMGIPLRATTQFEVEWKRYLELEPHKSFAVAGNPEGSFASGYAYARPTRELAIEEALAYCERRRADRHIESACRTWAVGDERVIDSPD